MWSAGEIPGDHRLGRDQVAGRHFGRPKTKVFWSTWSRPNPFGREFGRDQVTGRHFGRPKKKQKKNKNWSLPNGFGRDEVDREK